MPITVWTLVRRGRLIFRVRNAGGVARRCADRLGAAHPLGIRCGRTDPAIVRLHNHLWFSRGQDAGEPPGDPGRTFIWITVLLACAVGLFASAYVLRRAQALAPESPLYACVLSLTAVISAWLLTNASFTLRYAHLYFRDDGSGEGGLQFPGDEVPDALDFAYLRLPSECAFKFPTS